MKESEKQKRKERNQERERERILLTSETVFPTVFIQKWGKKGLVIGLGNGEDIGFSC